MVVELGHALGRTGARTLRRARDVADAVARTRAWHSWGWPVTRVPSSPRTTRRLWLRRARSANSSARWRSDLLASGHLPAFPSSARVGSAYFDAVVDTLAGEAAWRVVLRSGCYVTHDHGLYRSISAFERARAAPRLHPALEVWHPCSRAPNAARW